MKDRKHNTHKFKFLNSHFSPCIFTPYTGSIRHQRDRIAIPGSLGTRFSLFHSEKLRVFLSELSSEEWQFWNGRDGNIVTVTLLIRKVGLPHCCSNKVPFFWIRAFISKIQKWFKCSFLYLSGYNEVLRNEQNLKDKKMDSKIKDSCTNKISWPVEQGLELGIPRVSLISPIFGPDWMKTFFSKSNFLLKVS